MHSALFVHVRAMSTVFAIASKADHHELKRCDNPVPALLTTTTSLPVNREDGEKPAVSM